MQLLGMTLFTSKMSVKILEWNPKTNIFCWRESGKKKTWRAAQKFCLYTGSRLANFTDVQVIKKNSNCLLKKNQWWISWPKIKACIPNDLLQDRFWSNGSSLNYLDGEKRCASIKNEDTIYLEDRPCDSRHFFICKREACQVRFVSYFLAIQNKIPFLDSKVKKKLKQRQTTFTLNTLSWHKQV